MQCKSNYMSVNFIAKIVVVGCVFVTNFNGCFGRWWVYSRILSQEKQFNKDGSSLCYYFHLNEDQLKVCLDQPKLLFHVGKGTESGIATCQRQFYNERWNCSSGSHNSKLYKKRTPESAYVSAISSAGVIYNLVYECDRGKINDCSCTEKMKKHKSFIRIKPNAKHDKTKKTTYFWSHCTDHIRYGLKLSRIFLDPMREETFNNKTHRSLKKLVLIQNNRAARRLINELSTAEKKCVCHGPTGHCMSKICYRWLPDIQFVSQKLYKKYQNTVKVKLKNGRKLTSAENERLLAKTDLVYTERLNYCDRADTLGIPGTKGRLCSNHKPQSGDDMTSCDILCCGRGYNPSVFKSKRTCSCKFTWCCEVTCKECVDDVTEYRCK